MGQQQIINRTTSSELLTYETSVAQQANQKMNWDCYRIGCEYDEEKYDHELMMIWVLSSQNIEIKEIFDNLLKGEATKQKKQKCAYYKQPEDLYELWLRRGNRGSREDFLDLLLTDENWDILNNW
jgi:hypothetical protein|tara:strand:- start:975 stop:1349 length:375 start_codon:yes stop_codon:yes gene_type:complete